MSLKEDIEGGGGGGRRAKAISVQHPPPSKN